jgi:aspartate beta-hydroxylase
MTQAALLNREAVTALANRRLTDARDLLTQALALDAKHLPAWINLAIANRMEGDLPGAMQALDQARIVEPLHFPALLMRGSLYEAMDKPRHAAMAYNIALTQMLPSDVADVATRRAVEHARSYVDAYKREMESFLVQQSEVEHLSGASAPVRRMQGFLDGVLGRRKVFHSSPTNFYYPGLPSIEIFDRDEFPWIAELEALTPDIQAELANVFDDEVEPYVQRPDTEPIEQWGELNRSKRWSAYHFANHGQIFPAHRSKCPKTAALLDRMPQPQVVNRSPAALFSILQPKTHIPPHCGVANFRLVCHLPLVLPPDCWLRVGNSKKYWKMGEAFVFDDSIEHEAWNGSDQRRTVLIFDIWHPYLNEDERQFISRTIAAMDQFNAG